MRSSAGLERRRARCEQRASIEKEYADLYGRLSAASKWQSIYDTARFVLPKYAKRAPAREAKAANALLKALAGWAAEKEPSTPTAAARPRRARAKR